MKYLEKHTYIWHILAWLVFMLLPFLFSPMIDSLGEEAYRLYFFSKCASYVLLISFFYLNLYVLMPNLLKKKNWISFTLLILVSLIVLVRMEIFFFHVFMLPTRPFLPPVRPSFVGGLGFPFGRVMGTVLSFFLVLGVSGAIALWRDRQKEKELKQLIEYEKVAAELAVLKLQISPHFLFNTLNNIRWLARQKSDLTEDAIVKLSQLLRYIIYQANSGQVPLEQEINHLKNYIDLQKMRLTKPDSVSFTYEGTIKGRMIEPLLFMPFVENAFKYGFHSEKPSDIVFKIKATETDLIFESQNTIFTDNLPKDTNDSGIGIPNVQKRLELLYPNRHVLTLNTVEERNPDESGKGGIFYVNLKIT